MGLGYISYVVHVVYYRSHETIQDEVMAALFVVWGYLAKTGSCDGLRRDFR